MSQELQQAVDSFYQIYMYLRPRHYLKHRARFTSEENIIEVYEVAPDRERHRVVNVEGDSQEETYMLATLALSNHYKNELKGGKQ